MPKTVLFLIDDVHLEGRPAQMQEDFAKKLSSKIDSCKTMGDTPILICAGDIGERTSGIDWVSQFKCQTVYVCGNHEFWGGDYFEVIQEITEKVSLPQYSHIKFLHNSSCVINGIRFVGATLWTDLANSWPWYKKNHVIKNFISMADFRRISAKSFYENPQNTKDLLELLQENGIELSKAQEFIVNKPFNPLLEIQENIKSAEFLESALLEPFNGKTVVVTHHLPCPDFWMKKLGMNEKVLLASYINQDSLYQEYAKHNVPPNQDILMMGFYVNTLYQFFEQEFSPDIWIHGHFHQEINEFLGKTRIVSSPVGYLKQSQEMVFKEIPINQEKEQLIKYLKNDIEKFPWNEKLVDNLRDLEKIILQFEPAVGLGLVAPTDFISVLKMFQKTHENNLVELERVVSNWLYCYIKQQKITLNREIYNQYFITSNLSGFTAWMHANTKARFPEKFSFILNENSFMSEERYKTIGKNVPNSHYKDWVKESQKIQIQISQFKRALLDFVESLHK